MEYADTKLATSNESVIILHEDRLKDYVWFLTEVFTRFGLQGLWNEDAVYKYIENSALEEDDNTKHDPVNNSV